jgi:hypothetical protein
MVELLLKWLNIKPVFVWGNEKCEQTHICHPLNPNKKLVLKNMSRMFNEKSPRFRPLSINNTLLIDDCPFKCIGNVTSSYIIPQPFNSEKNDQNYLLGCLWPYLLGLSKAPTTLGYVGSHLHG